MLASIRIRHKGTYHASSPEEAVAMWYADVAARFVLIAAVTAAAV